MLGVYGGTKHYNQIVMDNTSANVNSWTLIETYYKFMIICSGCKCHFLNLIYKDVVLDVYCAGGFQKLYVRRLLSWLPFPLRSG